MMIFVLKILIDTIFGGLCFYIGYRIGCYRGYEKGRRAERNYWRGTMHR